MHPSPFFLRAGILRRHRHHGHVLESILTHSYLPSLSIVGLSGTAKVNLARQPPTKNNGAAALSKGIEARALGDSNWVTYPSANEAARVLRLKAGNISAVCRGKVKRAGNCTFRFIKDEDLQGEIWKPIPEALFPRRKVEGMMASNFGRILTTKGVKTYGSPSRKYLVCSRLMVHRLVAAAWLCGY